MSTLELNLPTDQYRSMPIPGHTYQGKPSKIANCYVRASDIPEQLEDWMGVNPRMPARKRDRVELSGRVARRIIRTLQDAPELMSVKNQGIYILVEEAEHSRETGGAGNLRLVLTDKKRHGIANGGHTFHAVREVVGDEDQDPPVNAYVRLHIMENVDPEMITEIAEGLNRSLQVDDASLHNLEGKFDVIKNSLKGQKGADEIAYRMGDEGQVDVQEVLARMAALNLDLFPEDGKQPNTLFGQPTRVLSGFVEDIDQGADSAYGKMLPHLHDILSLYDHVYEECARYSKDHKRLALLMRRKGKETQKKNPRPAVFAEDVVIDRRIFAGLMYPVFAAFRANVSPKAWARGRFEWIVDPVELLTETIDPLCEVIRQAYEDNGGDPAWVGKKQAAYLSCYHVVLLRLARKGKLAN
jgi:hypothetical protein